MMHLDIDWSALLLVLIAAFTATVVIVSVYSLGLRLFAHGPHPHEVSGSGEATSNTSGRNGSTLARTGAYACFAFCTAAVLYGIYLVIPIFHG